MKKVRKIIKKNYLMLFKQRLNFKLVLLLAIILALLLKVLLLSRTCGYFISDETEYSEMAYRIFQPIPHSRIQRINTLRQLLMGSGEWVSTCCLRV